ncbi:MAG: hypothetical protein R3A52_27095 [Polyangiales bacterium]
MTPAEARLVDTQHVLLVTPERRDDPRLQGFFGAAFVIDGRDVHQPDLARKTVYLCGDLSVLGALDLASAARVFVLDEPSHGEPSRLASYPRVSVGRAPVGVHGVGVLFPRFFDAGGEHFHRVCAEHVFQSLTESTKPGTAHRTGIYLTPVTQDGDDLHFRLLRCSTNLSGPTENFRATDRAIVDALRREADTLFEGAAPLNHVLAQVYRNTPATAEQRQSKARISAHADKTKDMPAHGIMAFCTFYDRLDGLRPLSSDPFDLGHRETSALTRLRFRLKAPAVDGAGRSLPEQFSVTLYPDSVFFVPLSTNRLYTHEIQAPALDAARLPTRLGYVVRCSKAEAVHRDGRTFLKTDAGLVPLAPATDEGMAALRARYADENRSQATIDYGDRFDFSMNQGDYRAPRP